MNPVSWKRRLGGAVIVLALALLVWSLGPLLVVGDARILESSGRRWVAIAILVVAWLAREAYRAARDRRRNARMVADLAAGAGGDDAAAREEAALLAGRFTAALEQLKKSRLGGRSGKLLYQLPWYMFIGAPGSGKTTALVNCGLHFPLAERGAQASAVGGVGGTRNCDWWFTDRAVLIDTAGRYTTQDSNAKVDKSAWTTFLQLLKRHRPRQPINGILVTLSVSDLLGWTPDQRQRYAHVVRQRVDELQGAMGLEFPVYVLVTKCDLVAGFSEFFATFDAQQRAQVWGATFNVDLRTGRAEDAWNAFDREFPPLLQRLNDLLLVRLQEEPDAERRALMYPFPQQFAAMGPLVSQFLSTAFSDATSAARPLVRGVYFTSGTQEGAPIDRLLGSLGRTLGMQGAGTGVVARGVLGGAAKSFFLTRLMSDVIFPEAPLAGFSESRESGLKRLSAALVAACVVVTGALLAAWTWSYQSNSARIESAHAAVREAKSALAKVGPPAAADLPVLVSALDALRKVPPAIHDPVREPPWRMTWGLYQGVKVDDQAGERYRNALQHGLLPRIALQLEAAMAAPATRPNEVAAALKAYRMLYDPKALEPRFFVATVGDMWQRTQPSSVAPGARFHLQELARTGDLQVARFHPMDERLVAAARERAVAAP